MICCKTNGDAHAPMVKPVRLDAIVEMVRGDDPGGTGHVLDDARRISRQVAADVARQHARVKIERTAWRIADDDRQGLVFVLLRLRIRSRPPAYTTRNKTNSEIS